MPTSPRNSKPMLQRPLSGLAEVVDENMSNAARMHAVENGKELSEFTMIAFGGAAPIHAARLCEKLGMSELLIPPGAGVGSGHRLLACSLRV